MKKIVSLLCFVLLINTINAQDTDKKNIVKLNITSFFFNSFNVSYERVFTDKITAQMSFFYFGRKSEPTIYGPTGGWGITPECRFYLSETKTAPSGFFLAPFLTLQGLTYRYTINNEIPNIGGQVGSAKSTVFGIGATVGYQWIFKDIITLDAYAGPGFGLASMNGKSEHGNIRNNSNIGTNALFPFTSQNGPIFRGGITLGFIF
ncbi:MAG: DUF3575 domain-containing protein [Bacteroidetes bacterium]|nr:MAG: DUF3575 domain-containing protein [Bacteroidota bacterium]